MTTLPSTLLVSLNDLAVGRLAMNGHGAVEFRWLSTYLQTFPRPVLGQHFLDHPDAVLRSRSRLPPWFSNLLPEGALRELIAGQAGFHETHEYALLNLLGQDLPGAVHVHPADDIDTLVAAAEMPLASPSDEVSSASFADDGAWHFSLAGVQLKFSAQRTQRGLTIPAAGLGGDWIVKLPDARFADVPSNEFATMSWAKACAIETPETLLVPLSDIAGLPGSATVAAGANALAVKRFDRPGPGQRVHFEDFAQVLGVFPEQKYKAANHETLASIVLALSGPDGLRDYLRRLVFVVASGNGDAHLKNWSLIYRDGVAARLSPAYDQVSTIQYMPQDKLALNLGRSKKWADITLAVFQRLARKLHTDERTVGETVEESVQVIRQAWRSGAKSLYTAAQQRAIEEHWRQVPLMAG